MVLGSGPNRIGQGIEFDYSCVHGVLAAKECGYETIMINCNPETVSTDFDIADKLRRELRDHGKINSDRAWDEMQVKFLTMHKFFTETSIRTRLPKKLKNLEAIKQKLLENKYVD